MKKLALFILLNIFFGFLFSANITWTNGNGTGIWNDPANWSAGIPGPADVAIFNATSTDDCLIDISIDLLGLRLSTGYTGTVTQGNGNTILIRNQDILMTEGNFQGGDSNIDMIDGNFTIRGGNFISTSASLILDVNFVVSDSGSFAHNNGTVIFNDGGNRAINILNKDTLFNMIVEPLSNNLRVDLNGADTLVILNKLLLNEGRLRGGPIEVYDSLELNAAYDEGENQIWLKGNENGYIFVNGDVGTHPYFIDKDDFSDTVFVENENGATINWGRTNDNLTIIEGTLALLESADLDFREIEIRTNGIFTPSAQETRFLGGWDNQGGLFNPNGGSWVWDLNTNRNYRSTVVDTFFNMSYEPTADFALSLEVDDSIYIDNRLDLFNGRIQTGNILIHDTAILNSTYDNGNADLWFVGSTTSNFFIESAAGRFDVFIRKDNSTDTVYFQPFSGNSLNIGETDRDLTIQEGVLSLGRVDSINIDYRDIFIQTGSELIASQGVVNYQGNWRNQGGDFDANNGKWIFDPIANDRVFQNIVTDRFFNLEINGNNNIRLNIDATDSIYVENKLELRNSRFQTGQILVEDTAIMYSTYDDGSASLRFIGSTPSNFLIEAALGNFDVFITKDSPTDTVYFQALTGTSLNIGETDRDLIIQEGVLSFSLMDTVNLDYQDLIIQAGAELLSTNGILNYQGNWDNQGGLFNANNGNWIWDNNGTRTFASTEVDTFFNFNYNPTIDRPLTMAADDSIYIQNKLELTNGRVNTGHFLVLDTAYLYATYDDATADLWFVGDVTSNFIIEAAQGNFDKFIVKDSPTDTVFYQPLTGNSLNIGETDRDLTIQEGILSFDLVETVNLDYGDLIIQPGAQLQASSGTVNYQGNWDNQGGLFNANNGNWVWDNTGGNRTYASTQVDTFYNFNYSPGSNRVLTLAADDSIYIENKLELTNGRVNTGHFLVLDTAFLYATYDDATADLWFIGDVTSNFIIEAAQGDFDKFIVKDNPTDTVFFQPLTGNSLNIGETDRDLTIQEGILSFDLVETANLDYSDIFIQAGAQLQASSGTTRYQGNWNNIAGGFDHNNGTWIADLGNNRTFTSHQTDTFNRFIFQPPANNRAITITAGDAFAVEQALFLNEGRVINGSVRILDTLEINANYDNGTSDIFFEGTNDGTFISNDTRGQHDLFINKTTPNLKVDFLDENAGGLNVGNANMDLFVLEGRVEYPSNDPVNCLFTNVDLFNGGTFQPNSGTLNFFGNWNNNQGKLDANGGTFIFLNNTNRSYITTEVDTFFNFTYSPSGNRVLSMGSVDTIRVINQVDLVNGRIRTGFISAIGDVRVRGTYDADNLQASLQFVGPNAQTFDLTGGTAQMDGDIYFDKSVAEEVTLNSLLDIDRGGQAMHFNKGYLVTTQTNVLFVDGAHPMIGPNDSSFVKGPVTKRGNQTFIFPIGDTIYAPMTISNISNGSAQFRGEYFKNDPTDETYDVSNLGAGLNNVSINEYWLLDRLATGASCRVNLSWRPTSGVDVPAELTIARWNNASTQWEDQGSSFTTGDANNGTITSPTITTFSPFTLASTTINNPLPVTYKYFEAIKQTNANLLEWVTLSEINADYFEVQKSIDGLKWEFLGRISANGNSIEEIKYQYTDFDIEGEIVYYRLNQVDFDGSSEHSEIRKIDRKSRIATELNIYPNPVSNGTITLNLRNFKDELADISIYSMRGELLYNKSANGTQLQRIDLDVSFLSKGTYFIKVDTKGEVITKKLIVL